MPKRAADYTALLDREELIRDGLAVRVRKATDTVNKLLEKLSPAERTKVLESTEVYAKAVAEHAVSLSKIDRYRRLHAENGKAKEETK